ncbi:MAG: FtsQ-type POTRA domain-containing protein [Nitriliruptorales bacterium]|nr:FtsQ-type POTRA domain-containing protein [Nitriliruptorales bacterium]
MDVRIRERRADVRRQQRRRRLRRTMALTALAAVLALIWAVERSSLVALDHVRVEGNAQVSSEDILTAAQLAEGTSTLRLDLDGADERITALPGIASAIVERVDAVTVRIVVVERVAELRLQTPTQEWLVDGEGVVFAAGNGPRSMPVVLLEHEVSLGDTAAEAGLADVMAVHAGLSGPLRARVTAYRIERSGEVALLLEGNLVAVLGDAADLDEKIRAVGAILAEIEGTAVTRIDVRVPSRPTVSED